MNAGEWGELRCGNRVLAKDGKVYEVTVVIPGSWGTDVVKLGVNGTAETILTQRAGHGMIIPGTFVSEAVVLKD